jgi:hypothetical protein
VVRTYTNEDRLRDIERELSDIKSMVSRLSQLFDPMKMSRGLILEHLNENAPDDNLWVLFGDRFYQGQVSLTEYGARKQVEEYLFGRGD